MNIPADDLKKMRDTIREVSSAKLTQDMPHDLLAEQVVMVFAKDWAPSIAARALREAADAYEQAMDDDAMFTSTWEFLRARADDMEGK